MKKQMLLTMVSMSFGLASFAAESTIAVQSLGFADMRVACQSPAQFHNQVAPTNIQIACHDTQYKWVPDTDGSVSMSTSRLVTSSLYSDKYTVVPVTASVASAPQLAGCAQFKEVAENVETVRAISCDELIAFNGTATDFCATTATSLRSANVEAIKTAATGRSVSLCGASASKAQRDQRDSRNSNGQN